MPGALRDGGHGGHLPRQRRALWHYGEQLQLGIARTAPRSLEYRQGFELVAGLPRRGVFCDNVLAAGQQELSSHFAQSDHTVFNGIDYDTSDRGVPLLPDSVARFECRTHQVHDCGDHYIIVGEVESYRSDEREPLLFYNGRYAFVSAGQD